MNAAPTALSTVYLVEALQHKRKVAHELLKPEDPGKPTVVFGNNRRPL